MSNETPEKNRKIGRIIAVVVAVVVIAALVVGGTRKSEETAVTTDLPEGCKPGYLFSETTGKPCPQPEAAAETPATSVASSSAYEEALRTYAGKLVMFDAACKPVAVPGSLAVGTRILVANNSEKQLTLAVGEKKEVLDGYHYFTTTLSAKGDAKVLCEGKESFTISVK